jgi:hypothetical protein
VQQCMLMLKKVSPTHRCTGSLTWVQAERCHPVGTPLHTPHKTSGICSHAVAGHQPASCPMLEPLVSTLQDCSLAPRTPPAGRRSHLAQGTGRTAGSGPLQRPTAPRLAAAPCPPALQDRRHLSSLVAVVRGLQRRGMCRRRLMCSCKQSLRPADSTGCGHEHAVLALNLRPTSTSQCARHLRSSFTVPSRNLQRQTAGWRRGRRQHKLQQHPVDGVVIGFKNMSAEHIAHFCSWGCCSTSTRPCSAGGG